MPPRPRRTVFELPVLGRLIEQHQERLTPRGRYLFWTMAAFALIGLDTRRTQVFVLFAALAGLFAVALAFALLRRPRARLECRLPERATAGRPLTLAARVTAEGGSSRDLLLSFPRPRRRGSSVSVTPRQAFVPAPAGGAVDLSSELRPRRRGRYVLRRPTLRATDPLGLLTGAAAAGGDHVLYVYPRFYTIADFPVPAGRRYQPGGIPLSSSLADAVEFVGTREYREGDPIRNIHWRSWARLGEPVVKEYQEEYFCRIALVLDTFLSDRASAAEQRGLEAAISVVASIADFFTRTEDIVEIRGAGPELFNVRTGRSLAHLDDILEHLAGIEPCLEPPFEAVTPTLLEELAQITTVVAVLLDWDARREEFVRRVKALGTEVRVLIVREGETAKPWRGVGPELGEIELLTPDAVERSLAAAEA